jgi:hypothetical protein
MQYQISLAKVIVDQAYDAAHQGFVLLQFPYQCQPGRAGTVNQRSRMLAFRSINPSGRYE